MKTGLVVLIVVLVFSGFLAFGGMVQAAVGAMKALFWVTLALVALVAAGIMFMKEEKSTN